MVVHYFCGLMFFTSISRSFINFVLSFILSSFYFLTICASFPFLLVPPGNIMMAVPLSGSRVLSSGGYTLSATSVDPAYDMPGWGILLCQPFLGRINIWSRCSDPTISVPPRWDTTVSL